MGIVAIIGEVISAVKLAEKVKDTLRILFPEPPQELTKKHRWYQCTIKNCTQFKLLVGDTYIDTGKWWTPPQGTSPFEQTTFSASNGDHNPGGATGGVAWKLYLDEQHWFYFSVGLTSPATGSSKAAIVESEDPEAGYKAATKQGSSIVSKDQYKIKDKDGNEQLIFFHCVAIPGHEMRIEITQTIVQEGDEDGF
ncbi:hypothetical protein BU24DRAFT_426922 [Aaosphaeria arxii CBS 175.79]|uniref:Uncharacterized protein n=1 Tax=Aaosphaeria arxii CBS 175.79 TaxID=1450172 RepID=A0A6A5XD18_9PLEO|nr:uncharacterized protein BU24DRAFT_426922 [Aaosphaeria arxii CBS 175.79]KAF2010706.1 hypothetical protein BU24DRAFT_426922 [Aaosphaeria arxii CBS 175.79]